jgi:DNA-binding response OmpR family regulator
MAIGWITTRIEPQVLDAFLAEQWELKVFAPIQFLEPGSFQPNNVDIIVFEISDRLLLDLCRTVCIHRVAPMLAIVMNLAYAQAALEAGADDFLVMPVDSMEAMLRIHKLAQTSTFVRTGELRIDLVTGRVTLEGTRVRMSSIEFRLLACLAKRAGHMVTHAEIMEEVWDWNLEPSTLLQVKNCVNRVRKKIERDAHNPEYILTVPGEGYRLAINDAVDKTGRRKVARAEQKVTNRHVSPGTLS